MFRFVRKQGPRSIALLLAIECYREPELLPRVGTTVLKISCAHSLNISRRPCGFQVFAFVSIFSAMPLERHAIKSQA